MGEVDGRVYFVWCSGDVCCAFTSVLSVSTLVQLKPAYGPAVGLGKRSHNRLVSLPGFSNTEAKIEDGDKRVKVRGWSMGQVGRYAGFVLQT